VEDLLGRDPVRLELPELAEQLAGKTVLVTGAAGSIGSELVRQLALHSPKRLILLDQAETPLYYLELDILASHPTFELITVVGSVTNSDTVSRVFAEYRPDRVFHAAAYKHVPLMESNALEAVRTNVLGTYLIASAAAKEGAEAVILVSTDKAVQPANVMGATKQWAERVVLSLQEEHPRCVFGAVRFGNVLGSNGSVVPLFQEQIAAGGPVTVTHPEIRRYFMTTREAVQLVLQAFTMGNGSDIFVLDMGEPVRIVDLARNMIRLSGLEPDEDIEIRYTGLRPGEKLFEELTLEGENILATYHEKIKIFQAPPLDSTRLEVWLLELQALLEARDAGSVVEHLKELVPEYQPGELWGEARVGAGGRSRASGEP
jgi:FlaA1/EpsC-like NDP-sugar epimerase